MAPASWRKLAFALLILAYFLYFNWDGVWVRFASDDMMNIVGIQLVESRRFGQTWVISNWENDHAK